MKKHLKYIIFVSGIILILGGDLLVGLNGISFGFTTSSYNTYQLIGICLFGIGVVLTIIGTYLCFLVTDSEKKKPFSSLSLSNLGNKSLKLEKSLGEKLKFRKI